MVSCTYPGRRTERFGCRCMYHQREVPLPCAPVARRIFTPIGLPSPPHANARQRTRHEKHSSRLACVDYRSRRRGARVPPGSDPRPPRARRQVLLRARRLAGVSSFLKPKAKEVGVALGLHVAGYDANLSGNFNGAPINSQSEKLTAPLPVLSAYGQFALTDRWAVGGRMDRFALKYGKFSGNLTGIALDVMYQPFKNVGFGIGSRALALKVAAEDEGRKAEFKQTFQGPVLFVNASF